MPKKKWDPASESSWNAKNADDAKAKALKIALLALKVDPRKLAREPKFTPILEEHALGGLPTVMRAMELSGDPLIQRFIDRYRTLKPEHQAILPWEAVSVLAGIGTRELLGAIIIALRHHSTLEVKIAALTAHATITKATLRSATVPGPDGYRDRHLLHTALGFLPTKSAPPMDSGSGLPQEARQIAAEDIDMNEMFPDLTRTQQKILDH